MISVALRKDRLLMFRECTCDIASRGEQLVRLWIFDDTQIRNRTWGQLAQRSEDRLLSRLVFVLKEGLLETAKLINA